MVRNEEQLVGLMKENMAHQLTNKFKIATKASRKNQEAKCYIRSNDRTIEECIKNVKETIEKVNEAVSYF